MAAAILKAKISSQGIGAKAICGGTKNNQYRYISLLFPPHLRLQPRRNTTFSTRVGNYSWTLSRPTVTFSKADSRIKSRPHA